MQLNELKKGFRGYKKESVYQYITTMNEEFSKKLLEKDEKNEPTLQELRGRAAALEAELAHLRQENDQRRRMETAVADSIIDAKTYAEQLRSESRRQEEALRAALADRMAEENRRVDGYAAQISGLRDHLRGLLTALDGELESAQDRLGGIAADQPEAEDGTVVPAAEPAAAAPGEESELMTPSGQESHSGFNMSLFRRNRKKQG